jgi:type I restriction enzyme S subunit
MSVDNNSSTERSRSIPNGWVETTLGKVCDVQSGGTPSTKNNTFWNGDIGWITPKDLSGYKKVFIEEGERSITHIGLDNSSAKLLPKHTILFSSRAPIGYVVISKNKISTNQGFKNLICDEVNSHYIYFYYLLKLKANHIEKLSSGSTFSEASASLMKSIEVSIPKDIKEQKAIAKILTAFDDKIENLQAQNNTLEITAQTIFKEWFGKYQIGADLPDGWRVFGMNELVETINGYSYKGKELIEESDEALVTLKSFDRNGGFQTRGFKPFKGNPKPTQEVKIGNLVVAHTDLTQDADVLGNPAFIFDNGGFKKMYITMDLVKVISIHKDISSSFLYYLMKDRAFKGHCVGYSNGTTVLHLSKKAIPEYQVFLPIDLIKVKEFSEIANATTNKISLNKDELKYLKQTRDTLLPKLMSGQLQVKDFKEPTPC